MAERDRQWEDWKRKQIEAVPRHARRRMRELLDGVPGPPAAWGDRIRTLREVGEGMRRRRDGDGQE